MAAAVLDVSWDPEALFFGMGLARAGGRVLKSDRYEAMRLGSELQRQASAFLDAEKADMFVPERCSLAKMQRFLRNGIPGADPELAPIVERCRLYLATLAPPSLTDGFLPVERLPHPVELTALRRAYSLFDKPWTLFRILGIGGLLDAHVRDFVEVMPEVYRAFLDAVVDRTIARRAASRSWTPPRIPRYQLPTLVGASPVTVPEVADIFAKKKAQQNMATPQSPDITSTATQRQANQTPSPKDYVR